MSFLHFGASFTMATGVVILVATSVKARNENTSLPEHFESNTRNFGFGVYRADWICGVDEHSTVGHVSLVKSRFSVGFSVNLASLESLSRFFASPFCTHVLIEVCLICVAREAVCFDQTVLKGLRMAFDFRSPLVGFLDAGLGQIDAPVDVYVVTNHEGVPVRIS